MAKRTTPKKKMEDDKIRKEKQPLQKAKGKVPFAQPLENDESEASDGSDDISEETEGSVNEEGDKDTEDREKEGEVSGEEGPGSEDDGLQMRLTKF
ncbi:uncharacterized protein LOC141611889 isoform X2 [Silene latifolia]|uniref:uncharacterized protein LOC141611889 isoform X2 n=1 Tax=Silene latifolia TaxID=37657 RepID=UPI003D77638E